MPVLDIVIEQDSTWAVVRDRNSERVVKIDLALNETTEEEEIEELYRTLVEDMFFYSPNTAYDKLLSMGFLKREHDCLH